MMSIKSLIRFILILSTIVKAESLTGQTCCSGGIPLSGNIGMPPSSKGSLQLNIAYDINYLGLLKSGTETLEESNRTRITQSALISTAYSFGDNISLEVFTSYVRQDRYIKSGSNTNHDFTSGIGDAAILVRYHNDNNLSHRGSFMLGAGPKIPIGKSDLKNTQGIVFNPDMQAGSGSWDMISYMQYSLAPVESKSLRSFIRFSYNLRGANKNHNESQTYKIGDELTVSLGINDMISIGKGLWNYSLSTRYRYSLEDEVDDFGLPNTGGSWLFGSLSIGYNISTSLLLHISSDLPLYSNPHGTQLSTSYRFNLGLFKYFGNDYSSIIIK
jgi:hypothetical protein